MTRSCAKCHVEPSERLRGSPCAHLRPVRQDLASHRELSCFCWPGCGSLQRTGPFQQTSALSVNADIRVRCIHDQHTADHVCSSSHGFTITIFAFSAFCCTFTYPRVFLHPCATTRADAARVERVLQSLEVVDGLKHGCCAVLLHAGGG